MKSDSHQSVERKKKKRNEELHDKMISTRSSVALFAIEFIWYRGGGGEGMWGGLVKITRQVAYHRIVFVFSNRSTNILRCVKNLFADH